MSKSVKKQNMTRDAKARREARIKEDMKNPINQFMNAVDADGKIKYPIAQKLRDYYIMNPDPILDAMRMVNSLIQEIREHNYRASKYYTCSRDGSVPVDMYDKFGKIMTREECYISYIRETQTNHVVLSKLRQYITQNLLSVVDSDIFTFDQYNEFVLKTEIKIKELGYDLFIEKIEIIEPL